MPELMIASAISLVTVGGVLVTQFYGMRMFEASSSSMQLSTEARQAMNRIMDDVRSAQFVRVGNGGSGWFTSPAIKAPKQGYAMMLYPGTNRASYIRYYLDLSSGTLRRMTNGAVPVVFLTAVTNKFIFSLQDSSGTILTNDPSSCLVSVDLIFDSQQISSLRMGTGSYYRAYELRTKVAHRKAE